MRAHHCDFFGSSGSQLKTEEGFEKAEATISISSFLPFDLSKKNSGVATVPTAILKYFYYAKIIIN